VWQDLGDRCALGKENVSSRKALKLQASVDLGIGQRCDGKHGEEARCKGKSSLDEMNKVSDV
jgi:hypothetical protein